MKSISLTRALTLFASILLFSGAVSFAEEPMQPVGMEGMHAMMGSMHECMEKHKNGKMCDHEAMDACQKKKGKSECQEMMKQAKAQAKGKEKSTGKTTN